MYVSSLSLRDGTTGLRWTQLHIKVPQKVQSKVLRKFQRELINAADLLGCFTTLPTNLNALADSEELSAS